MLPRIALVVLLAVCGLLLLMSGVRASGRVGTLAFDSPLPPATRVYNGR